MTDKLIKLRLLVEKLHEHCEDVGYYCVDEERQQKISEIISTLKDISSELTTTLISFPIERTIKEITILPNKGSENDGTHQKKAT